MSQSTPPASETFRLFASPPPAISSSSEPPVFHQPKADSSTSPDATTNLTSASLGLNQQVTFARRRLSEDVSDMKFTFSCVFDANLLVRRSTFQKNFRGIQFDVEFFKPLPSAEIECRVYCNKGNSSRLWRCTAAICRTMWLPASIWKEDEYVEYEFSSEQPFHDLPSVGHWTCLMDFRFKVVVRSVAGIPLKHEIDFTKPKENVFDGILVVEDQKVYVGKSFLAMYSPYFNALFFSGFHESRLEEIQITGDDIKYKDFIDFLSYIYPNEKRIKRSKVETLLKYADRFDVSSLTEKCERWLMKEQVMDKAQRLLIAEQYRLAGLQNHILRELKTQQEIQRLSKSPSYAELTDASKTAILTRMIEIMDSKIVSDNESSEEEDVDLSDYSSNSDERRLIAPVNIDGGRLHEYPNDFEEYRNRMERRHQNPVPVVERDPEIEVDSEEEMEDEDEDESMDYRDQSDDVIVVD